MIQSLSSIGPLLLRQLKGRPKIPHPPHASTLCKLSGAQRTARKYRSSRETASQTKIGAPAATIGDTQRVYANCRTRYEAHIFSLAVLASHNHNFNRQCLLTEVPKWMDSWQTAHCSLKIRIEKVVALRAAAPKSLVLSA
jgi:hypothetical protein